jgi:hypothetical protein
MEVKPVSILVRQDLLERILTYVNESELDYFFSRALHTVLFKRSLKEVFRFEFDYSKAVPVRFNTDIVLASTWWRMPREVFSYLLEALDSELEDLLIDYEYEYYGGK